jgi:hypothetical protein
MSWLEPLLPSIVSFPLSFPLWVPKLRLFLGAALGSVADEELKLLLQMLDAPCHLFRLLDEKPDMGTGRGCDEKDEDIIDQCTDVLMRRTRRERN